MLIKKYSYKEILKTNNLILNRLAQDALNNHLDIIIHKLISGIVEDLAKQSKSERGYQVEDINYYFNELYQDEIVLNLKDEKN